MNWQKELLDIHEKHMKEQQKLMAKVISKELGVEFTFDKPGCGLLIAMANGKPVACGDILLGKERYCAQCSLNTSSMNNQRKNVQEGVSNSDTLRTKTQTASSDNQQKKDDEAIPVSHLETRSSMEEDKTWDCKTNDVDNHAEIDNLTKTRNRVSRIEGCQLNPQECSRKANVAYKEDTSDVTLSADFKLKLNIKNNNI